MNILVNFFDFGVLVMCNSELLLYSTIEIWISYIQWQYYSTLFCMRIQLFRKRISIFEYHLKFLLDYLLSIINKFFFILFKLFFYFKLLRAPILISPLGHHTLRIGPARRLYWFNLLNALITLISRKNISLFEDLTLFWSIQD